MAEKTEKVAGILGGMGPEATVDLMQRIIALTPAADDADHVRCIVDNNPKVPSRIKAIIEGNGEDPGPCMADMGRRLETWGADFLVIACNTAHHYYQAVQDAVDIPVIHLVGLVTDHLLRQYPQHTRIGILASPAVAMTGLYTQKFRPKGLTDIWPDPAVQDEMLNVIMSIKRGDLGPEVVMRYTNICSHLAEKGATLAVVACTELSALDSDLPIPSVDAAQVLAQEIVDVAKNRKPMATFTRR